MDNHSFCFKVEGLDLIKNEEKLKKVFIKLNSKSQEVIFNNPSIYFSSNNNKIIKYIYEKLSESFKDQINIEFINYEDNFHQLASVVFPFPENEKIYDIVSISADKEYEFKGSVLAVKDNNQNNNILNPFVCKHCYKKTPQEISFCIYCGFDIKKEQETLQDYRIKINRLDYESKVKISKYFSDISNVDYSEILNNLGNLPVIIELKTYHSYFLDILEELKVNNISYSLIEFSIEKLISMIYSSINLGKLDNEYNYINKTTSKVIKDILKNINSTEIKEYIGYCLYDAYQIINQLRNSEKSAYILLKDTEKEINIILEKFMYLANRADKLKMYLSENNTEKLKKEISVLEKNYNLLDNDKLKQINKQTLDLKTNEIEDLIKIKENFEIINHEMVSVNTLLKSIRTKVAYINTYDIQENKGEFSELNNIKSNLILKIKAIDETLRY